MEKEFLPYQESLELKELGFKEKCAAHYIDEYDSELELKWRIYRNLSFNTNNCVQAPLYQQAFKFFREKYNFRFSIGNTNISVIHYLGTTQLLQDNATYEDAELATIKWFIDAAKNLK
jgi:hypothetical protein